MKIADEAMTVQLDWADGHTTRLPWWYLRGFCPCASCQGHGGSYAFVARELPPARLADVLEVGHYALNLTWDDRHRTGIYPFRLLRRLCACDGCLSEWGAGHVAEQLSATDRDRARAVANPGEPG